MKNKFIATILTITLMASMTLVGIVGAVAFRLFIHMKSKKAKKFRRDEEYGSARWGNEKDIKPFVDPKFVL